MTQAHIDSLKDRPDKDILTIFNNLHFYKEMPHDEITKNQWTEAVEDEVIHRNLRRD